MQPAVLSFFSDTDERPRRAAVSASRPDRLTFENLETRGASGETRWGGGLAWPLWCLKLVKVTVMLTIVDTFSKQSAEQVSHVTERERMAQEAVRESQDLWSRHGSCDW